jgi:hypothetical protein
MSLRGPFEVTQASPVPVGHPRGVVILEPADQPDLPQRASSRLVHVPADAFRPVDRGIGEVNRHGGGLGGSARDRVGREHRVAPAQDATGGGQVLSGRGCGKQDSRQNAPRPERPTPRRMARPRPQLPQATLMPASSARGL